MVKVEGSSDFLLVIDANKYLDLYRSDTGLKVLKYLTRISEHIFITKQLVDEVNRNKVNTISDFLSHKVKMLSVDSIKLPEHLVAADSSDGGNLSAELSRIKRTVAETTELLKKYSSEVVRQTANSEDEVSRALSPIFANAIAPSSDEFERARSRKELGNPPGKRGPLGDELLWEQILTNLNGKRSLWLITSDSDFCAKHNDQLFLNAFLKQELNSLSNSPEVFLFDRLLDGIRSFAEANNIALDIELSDDELDEIEDEEQALNIADQIREINENSNLGVAQSIAAQMAAFNDLAAYQNLMPVRVSTILGGASQTALREAIAAITDSPAMKDYMSARSILGGQAQRLAAATQMAGYIEDSKIVQKSPVKTSEGSKEKGD